MVFWLFVWWDECWWDFIKAEHFIEPVVFGEIILWAWAIFGDNFNDLLVKIPSPFWTCDDSSVCDNFVDNKPFGIIQDLRRPANKWFGVIFGGWGFGKEGKQRRTGSIRETLPWYDGLRSGDNEWTVLQDVGHYQGKGLKFEDQITNWG